MLFGKIKDWHKVADKYQITHSYGLFRSMTGVGGRPEVIIEGSNNAEGPWKEYEFLYKPGNMSRKPPFVVPHQPRIDWQIWFAALGQYQQNPWFLSLVYRLLKNQPEGQFWCFICCFSLSQWLRAYLDIRVGGKT